MAVFVAQNPEKHGRRAAGVPHSAGNKNATARPGEDKRYVQKQLGYASAETTRKYQHRRDRFHVNAHQGERRVVTPAKAPPLSRLNGESWFPTGRLFRRPV